jgi:predicted amino acid racemase
MLDVDKADIDAVDDDIKFVGITSDMLVIDIGANKKPDGKQKYTVGDKIKFKPNYMAVARLLNSKFIEKRFV